MANVTSYFLSSFGLLGYIVVFKPHPAGSWVRVVGERLALVEQSCLLCAVGGVTVPACLRCVW